MHSKTADLARTASCWHEMVGLKEIIGDCFAYRFEPTAKQQEPEDTGDYDRWAFDWPGVTDHDIYRADKKYPAGSEQRAAYLRMCAAMRKPAEFNLPKDNPDSARAILDLDRKPLTERQQQIGENIARAVANLSRKDNAFVPCAAEYQP